MTGRPAFAATTEGPVAATVTDDGDTPSRRQSERHEKTFAARRDQVREARRFLVGILNGCPCADDVLLAASEFTSNSVLYSASSRPGGTFTVAAEILDDEHVRIEVRDQGGPWIQRDHHDGRMHGLDIIARLAVAHGFSGDPLTGWTTWAILPWHPAPVAQSAPDSRAHDRHDDG